MWRHARQLIVLTTGAAVAMVLLGTAPALAWGSDEHGGHGSPVVHPTTPSPRPSCPPTRPPVTRPPVTRPPATRPPVTHPPSTPPPKLPPTTLPAGGHTAGPPPTTKPPVTTTPTTTTGAAVTAVGAAAGPAARLDSFDTFQAFVKGLEADARADAARAAAVRSARAARSLATGVPSVGGVPAAVDESPAPAPDVFPHGPLFNDSPAPLLPLGASGLRSARSFVLLFGLSAVALGFLAFRARMARRHGMFGAAVYDERGDYVDFA